MNTQNTDSTNRPLGYWLTAADRLMAAEFAAAFQDEGLTRRDWRLLNLVAGPNETDRRLPEHKLARLIERGWVARTDGGWTLTDDGRAAQQRLGAVVDGIRQKVADAVSPEDYAITLATLEQIARAYGWEEGRELPRGRGGFGRGHRHGFDKHDGPFGPRHGFGPHHRFGPHPGDRRPSEADGGERPCRPHGEFRPHERHGGAQRHAARAAQHAYERGFDVGFERGAHVR